MSRWPGLLLGMMICAQVNAADCTITLPTLNFGSYDPLLATNTDSSAVVRVTCMRTVFPAETVGYTLTSSIGNGSGYAARRMVSGTEVLNYNIYTDAVRTQVWGNATAGSVAITGSFTLNSGNPIRRSNHTLYGRIPPLQNAAAGNYADTLIVTLTF